jgi:anti-sigma B factor antagonist
MLGLHGEADLGTAPILAHALAHASDLGHAGVVLDATGLEFIDAYCIGIIAGARTRLRERERDLVVSSPPDLVRRVLSILGMEDIIVHPRC